MNVADTGDLRQAFFARSCFRDGLGQVLTVETSTDLSAWSGVGTVTNLNGMVEFADADAALTARRFYRVSQR